MIKTQIFNWEIEYDKELTIQAYTNYSMNCDCTYCRNYLVACQYLPQGYYALIEQLGIDARKPTEIVEFNPNADGTHFYGWWYHIVGRITSQSESKVHFSDGIELSILDKDDLLPRTFSRPVIQIEFYSNLPWLLPEKP